MAHREPDNEAGRIAALQALDILGTPRARISTPWRGSPPTSSAFLTAW